MVLLFNIIAALCVFFNYAKIALAIFAISFIAMFFTQSFALSFLLFVASIIFFVPLSVLFKVKK
ncbi:hypothetical protein [Campylobacter canadensis]|uniref:Uncharacterized protein n=1 Tax=Campylobacter canadensis TaxID=449520 RepID=A0ABS7WU88_9BACT|nr:hypothetical protein [Campylobacter canadensis]MBZ7987892.1 hypothetical protein [Campylobacter canadensis]MBZ7995342.1 hypothetical protein [Campylobacter canadensis]MBZ7996332.1 hypothetical protein [Campylobacter canadensis]MBZ7998364.1 hypothetical protein [Campylobacter canadensis]MBZ8003164.1 hypothetical protein [Campylobacter canadensis]